MSKPRNPALLLQILELLRENGPMTTAELATALRHPAPSISSAIGYLHRIGSLEKLPRAKKGAPQRFQFVASLPIRPEKGTATPKPATSATTKKPPQPTPQRYNDIFWDAFLRGRDIPNR